MSKIRILLIEDNRLLREGLAAMLNEQADMKVVASSPGNEDIVLKARASKALVILVDLGLRHQNGVQLVSTVSKELPKTKLIGMGLVPTQSDIVEFVQAGASGFILKSATIEEFLTTLRSVARGEKVLPPTLTHSLFTHVVDHAMKNRKGLLRDAVRMTKREREIIVLITEGMSNKEIASRLHIATYTVKSHVHNILEKLALHTRLQIATQSHHGAFD